MSLQGNNKAIDRMFKSVTARVATASEATMKDALAGAVVAALAEHQLHNWGTTSKGKKKRALHTILGDTYGWILLHNRAEVAREVTSNKRDEAGKAHIALDQIRNANGHHGWVGYVLACMEPLTYYKADLEREFLGKSANEVVATFATTFKKYYPVK